MGHEIRPARVDDYEAVCALYASLDAHHVQVDPLHFRPYQGPGPTPAPLHPYPPTHLVV